MQVPLNWPFHVNNLCTQRLAGCEGWPKTLPAFARLVKVNILHQMSLKMSTRILGA